MVEDLIPIYEKNRAGNAENWNVQALFGIIQIDDLVNLLNKLP